MQAGRGRAHQHHPPGPDDPVRLGDDALLLAIQRRDEAALAALYDRYGRLAYGLAYRLLGERGGAEDVVQEAFLAVWRHAARYRPERGGARSWLLAIVHNAAIDRRRGRLKREATALRLDPAAVGLEGDIEETFAAVAEGIRAEHVRRALADLPVEQRQAIELAYFGGLTHQEIAERTGTPLGTVKSRLRLGLQKLRLLLGDLGEPGALPPARPDAGPGPKAGPRPAPA